MIFFLTGCATPEQMISQNRIYAGMTKNSLNSAMISMNIGDDIRLGGCTRDYFPESRHELFSSESRKYFYLFRDVSERSINKCQYLTGNGVLLGVYRSATDAIAVINNTLSDTNNDSGLPNCPSDVAQGWNNCFGATVYDNSENSGDRYVGSWKNSLKHGTGTYTYNNGDKYVGEFKNDNVDGKGTFTFNNGEKYVGDFKNGKREGQGVNNYSNGDLYVGQFQNDLQHGQGTYTFSNTPNKGDQYVGEWRDNKINGQGTYTWASGQKYIGGWRDSKREGMGVNFYPDGRVQEGMFVNDEYSYYAAYEPNENDFIPQKSQEKKSIENNEMLEASSGTGFAVSFDGHIITNHHVIEACQEVKVRADGSNIPARITTFDSFNDLAILKVESEISSVLPISDDAPELLQEIYVAGFPFGEELSTSIKMTDGIISSLSGVGNNYSNIQISAALQPGNSGGPIFDNKGNVVGVAVATLDKMKMFEIFETLPENTNFGIKSSVVKNFLQSNGIENLPNPQDYRVSSSSLGNSVRDATYYVSCMMTVAHFKNIQSKKVIYSKFFE